jgi:anaerobic ribonucleoside-triphosphate reductase
MNLQTVLEAELERLKRKLQMGYELKVIWIPNGSDKLSGEVKGETIFIYEESERQAVETLRHEVLDYAIGKVIEPYKEVTNKLIQVINEEAYRRKEKLIEQLLNLLSS